jgi:hypothetical protein
MAAADPTASQVIATIVVALAVRIADLLSMHRAAAPT